MCTHFRVYQERAKGLWRDLKKGYIRSGKSLGYLTLKYCGDYYITYMDQIMIQRVQPEHDSCRKSQKFRIYNEPTAARNWKAFAAKSPPATRSHRLPSLPPPTTNSNSYSMKPEPLLVCMLSTQEVTRPHLILYRSCIIKGQGPPDMSHLTILSQVVAEE